MVYIHEWQGNSIEVLFRENFNLNENNSKNALNINSADFCIDKGLNIGIFYQTQLSDKADIKASEVKIQTTFRLKDVSYRNVDEI